jgi:hypothetical protein
MTSVAVPAQVQTDRALDIINVDVIRLELEGI